MELARVVSVRVSTLAHATEDREKVLKALREICSGGETGNIESTRVRGHYGNEIIVFRAQARTRKQAESLFLHLWGRLSEADRNQIELNAEEYVDSAGTMYVRIDKQESCRGQVILGESDPIKAEVQFAMGGQPGYSTVTRIRNKINDLSPSRYCRTERVIFYLCHGILAGIA